MKQTLLFIFLLCSFCACEKAAEEQKTSKPREIRMFGDSPRYLAEEQQVVKDVMLEYLYQDSFIDVNSKMVEDKNAMPLFVSSQTTSCRIAAKRFAWIVCGDTNNSGSDRRASALGNLAKKHTPFNVLLMPLRNLELWK